MSWPINGGWQEEGAWMDEEEVEEEVVEEEEEVVTIVGKDKMTLKLEIDWAYNELQFMR